MNNATLNARSALDSTGGFTSSTDLVGFDHNDEYGGRKDRFDQEEIDLGERRKYSTMSGKSDMSSVEVPERNSTVDAGKSKAFFCNFTIQNNSMKLNVILENLFVMLLNIGVDVNDF